VREIARLGGDVSKFVAPEVVAALIKNLAILRVVNNGFNDY
jgi:phosphopantetheine adenylyltransferase